MRAMDRHEADRTLQAAATRSPELAAMLAGKHDDPSARYRRLAVIVGVLALGLGLLWAVTASLSRERKSEPALEIDRSVYLPPIETSPAAGGEETSPFAGFAVSVDTDPAGAVVAIAGQERGEAPVLASVTCRHGEKVAIRAEKDGFKPLRRELACRADTLVKVTLRLDPR